MGHLTEYPLCNNNYLNEFKCPREIVISRCVNSVCINISITRRLLRALLLYISNKSLTILSYRIVNDLFA